MNTSPLIYIMFVDRYDQPQAFAWDNHTIRRTGRCLGVVAPGTKETLYEIPCSEALLSIEQTMSAIRELLLQITIAHNLGHSRVLEITNTRSKGFEIKIVGQ